MDGKKVAESSLLTVIQMNPEDANPMGNVHGGIIMKHVDSTGGCCAIRHARRLCVTASIDRLDFHYPVYVGNLLILKASVNMAGRTSMEVGVRVEAEDLLTGETRHTASAYLTFVALDDNGKPAHIPPLVCVTEDEVRRSCEAATRREWRLSQKEREAECRI